MDYPPIKWELMRLRPRLHDDEPAHLRGTYGFFDSCNRFGEDDLPPCYDVDVVDGDGRDCVFDTEKYGLLISPIECITCYYHSGERVVPKYETFAYAILGSKWLRSDLIFALGVYRDKDKAYRVAEEMIQAGRAGQKYKMPRSDITRNEIFNALYRQLVWKATYGRNDFNLSP